MSAEFDHSPEYQEPHLEAVPTVLLRKMAEDDISVHMLNEIEFVALERANTDPDDTESAELALFIDAKREALLQNKEKAGTLTARARANIEEAKAFAQIIISVHMKDQPQLAEDENARISLFKRTEG